MKFLYSFSQGKVYEDPQALAYPTGNNPFEGRALGDLDSLGKAGLGGLARVSSNKRLLGDPLSGKALDPTGSKSKWQGTVSNLQLLPQGDVCVW